MSFFKTLLLSGIIALILFTGCGDKPNADFSYTPENPKVGDTVSFTNLSTDAVSFSWEFGDNYYSLEEHPKHAFSYSGDRFVRLVVKNGMKQDYVEKPIKVSP